MRADIFDIIELGEKYKKLNYIYSAFMLICIALSLIPLLFKDISPILALFDKTTALVFIVDYLLRLITADYKYHEGLKSFIKYPFSVMAIIDLISILPSLSVVNRAFKAFRILRFGKFARIIRSAKTIRLLKLARYSKSAAIIKKVLCDSKDMLLLLTVLAVGYIFSISMIVFNIEPNSFNNFFEALYWATISLTTIGYGDVTTTTIAGRFISMISSFVGVAIVTLPSGIITAGFVKEISKD